MSRPSSSTSNSEDRIETPSVSPRSAWRMGAWAVVWLFVLDVAASLVFAFPSDPHDLSPTRWQLYFDYGR